MLLLSVESGRSIIHFHYENRKTFNLRNITRVQERFKNNYSISVQVWFIAIPLTTYSGWRRCILVFPLLLLQKRCNMAYNNGFPHIVHWMAFKMLLLLSFSYTTEEMEWQMLITFWIRLCSVFNLMVMRIDSFYYVIAFYLINNVLTNIPFPHYLLIPGDDKTTLQFANPPRTVIIAITTLSM